jgi:hypothetical protein
VTGDFDNWCPERDRLLRQYVNAVLSFKDTAQLRRLPYVVDGHSTRGRIEDSWREYERHLAEHGCAVLTREEPEA